MARASTQKNQETSLAPRNAQQPMDLFRRQFDALFDQMWSGMIAPVGQEFSPGRMWDFGPARMWDFGVTENDKEITVRAEVPGFEEKELDVRLEQNRLTIQAEKEQKGEEQQEYRSFYRAVTLPAGIDPDQVQASYRNGVLELHIPRREPIQAKRIQIQGQPTGTAKPALGNKSGSGREAQQPATGKTGNGQEGQQSRKQPETATA